MRYAVFTDVHANLEALEAVLAHIDELAQQEAIDQIWFLGDLVGYGPNPNECISKLRTRTDVIIAGNHDWAAVGKIDLEDFSAAARISAEWTAKQLTEEHRTFLANLPERLEIGECTLVHGSPFGPLWEYLTSEVLAERSFQHFSSRYCFVGHTHVPAIFQQPDTIPHIPTVPLNGEDSLDILPSASQGEFEDLSDDEDTQKTAVVHPTPHSMKSAALTENAHAETEIPSPVTVETTSPKGDNDENSAMPAVVEDAFVEVKSEDEDKQEEEGEEGEMTPKELIADAEDRLNSEIEELLSLLGLSQSMVQVTNEMLAPPEGDWQAPEGYRAIINPGGVGQPRDGDSRAAFMMYDTERGFTFYRIPYDYEKTQEKIIKAGLPPYLAARLGYGR